MAKQINTEFFVGVDYNKDKSGVGIGADTLEEAMAQGVADASYYCGLGYDDVTLEITERCAECNGLGEVTSKRKGRLQTMKKCPVCKGKFTGFHIKFPVNVQNFQTARNCL